MTTVEYVPVHPLTSVPVTAYVEVEAGHTTTGLTLPPGGLLQIYETTLPVAVSVVQLPGQIGFVDVEMLIAGLGFTVTRAEFILVHPLPSVPVTV